MLFFTPNLSYLISKKGVKLQALGKFVGVTHSTISNWRDGIQYPDVKKLVKLCEYFDIEPNDIIFKDLTTGIEPSQIQLALPGNVSGKNLLIPKEAQVAYLEEWTGEYLRSLNFVAIPGIEGEARTFQVIGNAMNPLLMDGDYVACTASSVKEVQTGRVYVIVSEQIQMGYVQVEQDRLVCIPNNKDEFQPYRIPNSAIREVWEARAKITNRILDPLAGGYSPSRLRELENFLMGKFPDFIIAE